MMQEPIAPDIQEIPAISRLPEQARRYLQARLQRYFFEPGDIIIQDGRHGQFMGIVGHGLIDLESSGSKIRTLLPGQMLGEEMMVEGSPSNFKAVARSDTSLWVLTRSDWLSAIRFPKDKIRPRGSHKKGRLPILAMTLLLLLVLAFLILSPELPNLANHALINALLSAGHSDWVETYLGYSVKIMPDLAEGYADLGYSLSILGKQEDAIAAFSQAVSYDPSSASAQNNLGVALIKDSKPEQAIEPLKLASEMDPGNPEIFFNLGNAYLAIGDQESALAAYRRSAELGDDFLQARVQYAQLLMQMGDLAQSKSQWEQVLEREPGNIEAPRALGVIAVLEKRPQDSLIDLQTAITADPLDALSHLYLGLAFEALNQPSSAAVELAAAQMLTNDPAMSELIEAHLQTLSGSNPP